MRLIVLSSLVLVGSSGSLGSLACAAAPSPASALATIEGVAPGVTTIRFVNDLAAPSELESVLIEVDDEALPLHVLPPSGSRAVTLASLRLAPGAHALSVRVTSKRGDEAATVTGEGPFWVSPAPASIGVRVGELAGDRAPTKCCSAALALSMVGGRMVAN